MTEVKVTKDRYITDSLYQYDKNQELVIFGLSLPSIPEVHFSNSLLNEAIVKQARMDEAGVVYVDIPNDILTYSNDMDVYVCIYEGDSFKVLYKFAVEVKARTKPADYIASDDEKIYSYNALENKLENTLVLSLERYDEVNQKYEDVNRKYNEALDTLEESIEVHNQATDNLNNAVQDVNEALADHLIDVNELVDETLETLEAGIEEVNQAKESAQISATNASESATSASTSANTATTKASEASKSASNASTSATHASESAKNASGSAESAENAKIIAVQAQVSVEQACDQVLEEIANFNAGNVTVPSYWTDELETKANDIQVAMEQAGRKKSAFLWYTDAHWINGNSKKSPLLLDYLYRNTPMNKVKFGGDIIGDTLLATRDEMIYLYEWRKAIKNLPNHHSVFGNHDMFDLDSVDYENDNYRYSFLLAPEETPDMVMGDGNYYYIDSPAEKTRYLHLAYLTSDHTAMTVQGQFIVDAIKTVSEGWHIVAIAHRWWQYNSSATPTTGSIPAYETEIFKIFDEYNARGTHTASNYFASQNFADAKGKVEFCIGGHIHVDYDFFTPGGIPVIITTSDANQNRVPNSTIDSGTIDTVTESAVFGIIADYNEEITKITIVGVGRGTSRVVRSTTVTPKSITNITYSGDTTIESIIDKSKFSFTVNYSDGSTNSVTGANTVTPSTIEVVGNNSVIITYVENGITLTETTTIVGIAKPVVNLFDKNDPDMLDRGRINSSHVAVAYADNQLVTGYIEAKVGDTFAIETDLANTANNYVGALYAFDANKNWLGQIERACTSWIWSDGNKKGVITIPEQYQYSQSNIHTFTGTVYVRFGVAYTDMNNVIITKS